MQSMHLGIATVGLAALANLGPSAAPDWGLRPRTSE